MVTTPGSPARSRRLPRDARRAQLLRAAGEVFVARGYHAAGMDEIADRAGVSKPVLYQHFPGKLDLYLALLDQHTAELLEAVRTALSSTTDNKQRVAATISAYFRFVDREDEPFRLVFESDLTNESQVRERVDAVTRSSAEAIAAVIAEDTGLPAGQAEVLAVALAGMAHVTARYWISSGRRIPLDDAERLVAQLSWRGIRGFPKWDSLPQEEQATREG
ncbi:MAG: TetR/AcrR family transcriptional regulator [Actinomycetales bacterium]|nr:TetR/AcrR family transcriptional regulator [Actinomycetales bacterium]